MERLTAAVKRRLDQPAGQIRDGILSAAQTFTRQTQLDDDRTLLVIRYQVEVCEFQAPQLCYDSHS